MGNFLLQEEIFFFFLWLVQSNLNGLAGLQIRQNLSVRRPTYLVQMVIRGCTLMIF